MTTTQNSYNLLIASFLEPDHVERIRQVSPERLNVIYEPGLLAPPRYPADHYSVRERTPEEERRWRELLGQADILFDFDYSHRQDLPELAPQVRWIQASSAGIGQFVKRYGYDERMPHTLFTTASGIHARPLAEFVIMVLLAHYKGLRSALDNQRRKHWERYAGTDLEGRTMAIVGLGRIGSEVARLARALGMRTVGTNVEAAHGAVDEFFELARLPDMLAQADVLVLCVPHTPQTEAMIGAAELAALPQGAYFINIGRGAVVDEAALIHVLQSGHLAGAALDVFAEEPLPESSPLWSMPNVIVSPHSASTSDREDKRLIDLFCDNLRRFLDGAALRNVLEPERYY
jgi:glyoxylate/hydroxypyruvate reductase A